MSNRLHPNMARIRAAGRVECVVSWPVSSLAGKFFFRCCFVPPAIHDSPTRGTDAMNKAAVHSSQHNVNIGIRNLSIRTIT
eukprot:scaffold4201_cov178-Amphora_coffeaeformis.AAC.5